MDFYPNFEDVFDPDWFMDQLPPEDEDEDGVLGDDPFKETPTCGKCGRFMDYCICKEHVWNTVPF